MARGQGGKVVDEPCCTHLTHVVHTNAKVVDEPDEDDGREDVAHLARPVELSCDQAEAREGGGIV